MRITRAYHVHLWNCFDCSTNQLNSFTMLRVPTSRKSKLGMEGNVRFLARYLVNDEDWPGIDENSFTFVSDHELLAFDSYDEILYRFKYDGSFRHGREFLKSRMRSRIGNQ